jgi:hypothetical protein
MIKISKPSKMKITGKKVGCWSLEARVSCPGSKTPTGDIVEVCKGCYATKGMYRFPVVKAARQTNRRDYHKDDWVDRMVKEVSKYDYFRWFDSGDVETPELAAKIRLVIDKTSKTQHWLPTRSDKIKVISDILEGEPLAEVDALSFGTTWLPINEFTNVSLRPSADHIGLNNHERDCVNSYVIRKDDLFEAKHQGIFVCPVTLPGSTQKSCDTCTHCYGDKPVAYILH